VVSRDEGTSTKRELGNLVTPRDGRAFGEKILFVFAQSYCRDVSLTSQWHSFQKLPIDVRYWTISVLVDKDAFQRCGADRDWRHSARKGVFPSPKNRNGWLECRVFVIVYGIVNFLSRHDKWTMKTQTICFGYVDKQRIYFVASFSPDHEIRRLEWSRKDDLPMECCEKKDRIGSRHITHSWSLLCSRWW